MQIVPVIDLLGGQVVRAIAGDRANYQPIHSTLFEGSEPQMAIAALQQATGATTVYVADLDSLSHGGEIDFQLLKRLASHDCRLWVDANWQADPISLASLTEDSYCRPIISLETLKEFDDLKRLFDIVSRSSPIFSVDMQEGCLLTKSDTLRAMSLEHLVKEACDIGFRDLITLDLAAVGRNDGPILSESISSVVKQVANRCRWISGGGVRDVTDLNRLASAGCDYVLVASALHDGKISTEDAARFATVGD